MPTHFIIDFVCFCILCMYIHKHIWFMHTCVCHVHTHLIDTATCIPICPDTVLNQTYDSCTCMCLSMHNLAYGAKQPAYHSWQRTSTRFPPPSWMMGLLCDFQRYILWSIDQLQMSGVVWADYIWPDVTRSQIPPSKVHNGVCKNIASWGHIRDFVISLLQAAVGVHAWYNLSSSSDNLHNCDITYYRQHITCIIVI